MSKAKTIKVVEVEPISEPIAELISEPIAEPIEEPTDVWGHQIE